MFVLANPVVEVVIGLVIIFLLEVVLFWAASALADVPPLKAGPFFLVVFLVTAASVALAAVVGYTMRGALKSPLEEENRQIAALAVSLLVAVTWAAPAVLYPFLISVSIPKSMWVSMLQVLLRGFLYVLIAAIVMVVLAVYQILMGSEIRSDLHQPIPFTQMYRG